MDALTNMDDLKAKMLEEITKLERELRNELPKEILKARAHGDLRENAEFHAAKDRQRYVDARLSKLQFRLAELSMVDLSKIPHDRVGLGSKVLVLDVKKNEQISYKLVASEESDVAKGLISTSSPIGKGLLGKQVGDEVTIAIPGGQRTLEVLELKTIHDGVE
jgi:transcription elongation factor GreA